MKKTFLAIGGVTALAIAGWSALWFTGRGEIEKRLDAEIQAFAAQGVEISHGERKIGGFPFSYTVHHADVVIRDKAQGVTYTLPEITTVVTAEDIDRMVTTMPENFSAEITYPKQNGSGDASLRFDIQSTNLVIMTDGRPGEGQEIEVNSDQMLIVTAGEDQPFSIAVEAIGSSSLSKLPSIASGAPMTASATMERLDYAYTVKAEAGQVVNIEGSIDAPRMTAKSNLRSHAAIAAMFTGRDALVEASFQTSASTFAMQLDAKDADEPSTFSGGSGSSAGTLTIKDGQFEIATSSRANKMRLVPQPPLEASGGKPLGLEMRTVEGTYSVPLIPGDDPGSFIFRFALDEVTADDVLWGLIDPGGTIERTPARLIVDLEGSARLTRELTATRPGEGPPIEIGNLSVKALDLSALGASVTTRGDVEFLQPLWIPEGAVTVRMTNVIDLVDSLIAAGILVPQYKQTITVLAAIYSKPGEKPGELVSEVEMSVDGITVNGQPISAGQ